MLWNIMASDLAKCIYNLFLFAKDSDKFPLTAATFLCDVFF